MAQPFCYTSACHCLALVLGKQPKQWLARAFSLEYNIGRSGQSGRDGCNNEARHGVRKAVVQLEVNLQYESHTLTLSVGSLTLTNNINNNIVGTVNTDTLTNQETITGAGKIG